MVFIEDENGNLKFIQNETDEDVEESEKFMSENRSKVNLTKYLITKFPNDVINKNLTGFDENNIVLVLSNLSNKFKIFKYMISINVDLDFIYSKTGYHVLFEILNDYPFLMSDNKIIKAICNTIKKYIISLIERKTISYVNSIKDKIGNTLLHHLVKMMYCHPDLLEILDRHKENDFGETPHMKQKVIKKNIIDHINEIDKNLLFHKNCRDENIFMSSVLYLEHDSSKYIFETNNDLCLEKSDYFGNIFPYLLKYKSPITETVNEYMTDNKELSYIFIPDLEIYEYIWKNNYDMMNINLNGEIITIDTTNIPNDLSNCKLVKVRTVRTMDMPILENEASAILDYSAFWDTLILSYQETGEISFKDVTFHIRDLYGDQTIMFSIPNKDNTIGNSYDYSKYPKYDEQFSNVKMENILDQVIKK
jgi:hypothetical protein